MRTFSIISTLFVLLTGLGLVAPADAQWHETTSHNQWSLEIGGKAYDRPGSKLGLPLITDSNTNATLFDSNQATDLGNSAGAEVKFNFASKTGREWELRSTIANWDQELEPVFGPNIDSPFFNGVAPDLFQYNYESDYFSIELMTRQAIRPGVVFMFGPRVISTKDLVSFHSELLVDPGDGTPSVNVESDSTVEATNILMGLQTGFEFNKPIVNGIYANAFIRVGGYYNPTEVNTTDVSSIAALTQTTQTKSTGSFVGEVGGRVYYDLVPNCAALYAGYEATWIDGLALSPPQLLTATTTPSIETANTPFFHAVTFGLRFTY